MAQTITVYCAKCKQDISLEIYDESDISIEGYFDIRNVEHIRCLQLNYNVENEKVIISENKNIFHISCHRKSSKNKYVPFYIFLQLYYFTLLPDARRVLLDFVSKKLNLHGISKQPKLEKFSATFAAMQTHLALYFQLDETQLALLTAPKETVSAFDVKDPNDIELGRNAAVDESSVQLAKDIQSFYEAELPQDANINSMLNLSLNSLNKSRVFVPGAAMLNISTPRTAPRATPRSIIPTPRRAMFTTPSSPGSELAPMSPLDESTQSPRPLTSSTPRRGVTEHSHTASVSLREVRASFLEQSFREDDTKENLISDTLRIITDTLSQAGTNAQVTLAQIPVLVKRIINGEDWQSLVQQQQAPVAQAIVAHRVVPATVASGVRDDLNTSYRLHRAEEIIKLEEANEQLRIEIAKLRGAGESPTNKASPRRMTGRNDLEKRIAELEQEVERLTRELEQLQVKDNTTLPSIDIEKGAVALKSPNYLSLQPNNYRKRFIILVCLCALQFVIILMLLGNIKQR